VVRGAFKEAQETKRRRNCTLRFEDGVSQDQFIAIVQDAAKHTPRVKDVTVNGMTVDLEVRSNSGLSTWAVEVDFNDYGRLTGTYWLESENSQSPIPEHFARAVQARIRERATQ
jgi:hypothetical protein